MLHQQPTAEQQQIVLPYKDNFEHLSDELKKLDLLIQLKVVAMRQKTEAIEKSITSQQDYITHEEVDWLLAQNHTSASDQEELKKIQQQLKSLDNEIHARVQKSLEESVFLLLPQLAHMFALSPFELQTVIIALSPELDHKYDNLYAYLQDDVTRKKPSVDLVLDLLCDTQLERWQRRLFFTAQASLFRSSLLTTADDLHSPSGSSGLAQFLKLDQRILHFLLGHNTIDECIERFTTLFMPSSTGTEALIEPQLKTKLFHFLSFYLSEERMERKKVALFFHGPDGVDKRALAFDVCHQLNCPLLYLDMQLLMVQASDDETLLKLVFREGLLFQAAIYFDHMDLLLRQEHKEKALLKTLAALNAEYGWLIFLAGETSWSDRTTFKNTIFQAFELSVPTVALRQEAWKKVLTNLGVPVMDWAKQLAQQFRLTPGQIRDAETFVRQQQAMHQGHYKVSLTTLYTACRNQSNQKLKELALKIDPHYNWQNIVLPEDKKAQLHDICSQVKHSHKVFDTWGFERKLSYGRGVSVLFYGTPGTGKTMAAEVIANELQLDLYKIDLSDVVSKYIGETEKNLSKIFHEAQSSNAIVFFDEADALFGKRTEITDAHDRYANIETGYLLQKMEEYEGIVILATNLRENMDEAFTRRLRFIVEFPFPDAAHRLQIWKGHFPNEVPVSDVIDFDFLSKSLHITGGSIRNIILNAAFLAAEAESMITMAHILHATRREFMKIGKPWNEGSEYARRLYQQT